MILQTGEDVTAGVNDGAVARLGILEGRGRGIGGRQIHRELSGISFGYGVVTETAAPNKGMG